jgi:hypothetical protein
VAAEARLEAVRVLTHKCAQHRMPLPGHLFLRDPGLKHRAILYSRFAAKSDRPRRDVRTKPLTN